MSTPNYVTLFNDHFMEFVNDIQTVFPDDVDILAAKNALATIRKINAKLIVNIWKTCVVQKYQQQIAAGDINFFIDKDYSDDLSSNENSAKIMNSINRLRDPVRRMNSSDQAKTMKYMQNLTTLSGLIN